MAKPIISLIIIVLSIGFSLFYVKPAYDLNVARRGDIELLNKTISTSGEIKALIQETKANLQSVDADVLSRFEVFLPEKIDPIRLANNIQFLGNKNRIVLTDIKVETATQVAQKTSATGAITLAAKGLVDSISLGSSIQKAEGSYPTSGLTKTGGSAGKFVPTKITLSFVTTLETFQLFLNDIERSLEVFNVSALSFNPVDGDTDPKKTATQQAQLYLFNIEMETYSLQ